MILSVKEKLVDQSYVTKGNMFQRTEIIIKEKLSVFHGVRW